jgi:hypothetical protein
MDKEPHVPSNSIFFSCFITGQTRYLAKRGAPEGARSCPTPR